MIINTEFRKNVLTLLTGTTIAQLVPFLISPIITRLYSPEDLGRLALFISIVSILSIISTLKYDAAILLPKEEGNAYALFYLSNILVFTFFIVLFIMAVIFKLFFEDLLSSWRILELIWFIPFMVLFLGSYQPVYYLLNRNKKYKFLSFSRILQNASTAILNIVLGFFSFNWFGLIISRIAGQLLTLIYLLLKIDINSNLIKYHKIKEIAKTYIRFPKFIVLSQLINTFSLQLPVFFISGFFGSLSLGLFALSQRVILTPIAIISTSIGDVFRQRASEDFNVFGTCRPIYISSFKKLAYISALPFIAFFFIAPSLFSFVFGSEWEEAGVYAKVLTPMFFAQFTGKPLSSIFLVTEKQKMELVWQVLFMLSGLIPFALCYLYQFEILECLMLFSFLRVLCYLILVVWGYIISDSGKRFPDSNN